MSSIRSNTVPAEKNPPVFNGMQTALQSFETLYKGKCKAIGTEPNEIWLRWLKDAAMLSQSLLNTKLTVDLGACLVPQFIDLLEYATLLFTSDALGMTHMDAIRNCFTTFFNNISALIDSTNHSNRQFVQVPPFHPASFEMPPKIMAYYVALAHRLIDVLKDSNENYDLTISPKFAKELDVTSIAIPEVTGLNQFLSISIGEQSLYALRHTTEVFGHEISHFVGNTCRSRPMRKRLLLRVGIQTFLEDMAELFPQYLTRNMPVPGFVETMPDVGINWGKTKECVDSLYSLLLRTNVELSDVKDLYLRDVENELKDLPNFIISDPEICERVFRFLYESYFLESKWGTWYAKRSGESPDKKKPRTKWKSVEETRRKVYEAKLRQDFDQMFEDYIEADVWNQAESTSRLHNRLKRHEHFCYLFSETYADLQVIRLLNMSQEQYQRMFRGITAEDLKTRTLAVSTALAKQKIWKTPKESEEKLLALRPPQDTAVYLQEHNINPALFHAQVEYLCECSTRMTDKLQQDNLQAAIKDIRHIYSTMSKNGSVLELDKDLFDFVSRYYKALDAHLESSQ